MFDLLAPSCILCDAVVGKRVEKGISNISLCKDCYHDLPWLEHACKQCGIACQHCGIESPVCGACQKKTPFVDYTLSALHYVSPVDYFVTELKFSKQLTSAAIMSELLYQFLDQHISQKMTTGKPDFIIPVPLHKNRLRLRGFNQAVELAKPLARKFSIPMLQNSVIRTKNTAPQSDLDAGQRHKNIRNSFQIENSDQLTAAHVTIVDDVVTTGATCNELARLLKNAGVKKVGVWSVARA